MNNCFAYFSLQVIQLSCVVPGHGSAIIAMIDVVNATAPMIHSLENYCGICFAVIVILKIDTNPVSIGEIYTVKRVVWVRGIRECQKPIWMFHNPG